MKRILFWTLSVGLTQVLAIGLVAVFLHTPAKALHERDPAFRNAVVYDRLGVFVVNPASTRGNRFLTADLTLVLDRDRTADEVDAQKSEIRDAILEVLREMDRAELGAPGAYDRLEQQIADAVNPMLRNGSVLEVCINKLLEQ